MLALNSSPLYLNFLSVGITSMCHHTQIQISIYKRGGICVYACTHAPAPRSKRYWILMDMELQEAVSHLIWVLRTELKSPTTVVLNLS